MDLVASGTIFKQAVPGSRLVDQCWRVVRALLGTVLVGIVWLSSPYSGSIAHAETALGQVPLQSAYPGELRSRSTTDGNAYRSVDTRRSPGRASVPRRGTWQPVFRGQSPTDGDAPVSESTRTYGRSEECRIGGRR